MANLLIALSAIWKVIYLFGGLLLLLAVVVGVVVGLVWTLATVAAILETRSAARARRGRLRVALAAGSVLGSSRSSSIISRRSHGPRDSQGRHTPIPAVARTGLSGR